MPSSGRIFDFSEVLLQRDSDPAVRLSLGGPQLRRRGAWGSARQGQTCRSPAWVRHSWACRGRFLPPPPHLLSAVPSVFSVPSFHTTCCLGFHSPGRCRGTKFPSPATNCFTYWKSSTSKKSEPIKIFEEILEGELWRGLQLIFKLAPKSRIVSRPGGWNQEVRSV